MAIAGTLRGQWMYRLLLLALLAGNGWAQYILWFGDQGLVSWRRTVDQLLEVRKEEAIIQERIKNLEEEIHYSDKDPLILEEVARRELGLVYPNEILFVFPDKNENK